MRRSALLDELQRTYEVVVTGPTTLAAILNSLQMGFRTLAIQKHSGEVWTILGAVKKAVSYTHLDVYKRQVPPEHNVADNNKRLTGLTIFNITIAFCLIILVTL